MHCLQIKQGGGYCEHYGQNHTKDIIVSTIVHILFVYYMCSMATPVLSSPLPLDVVWGSGFLPPWLKAEPILSLVNGCSVFLCCVLLCSVVLCIVVLYCVVLCSVVLCSIVL